MGFLTNESISIITVIAFILVCAAICKYIAPKPVVVGGIVKTIPYSDLDKKITLQFLRGKLIDLIEKLDAVYYVTINYKRSIHALAISKIEFPVFGDYAEKLQLENNEKLTQYIINTHSAYGFVRAGKQTVFIEKLTSIHVEKVDQEAVKKEIQEKLEKFEKIALEIGRKL